MLFIYKTKDGNTGMVKDVDALPSNIKKLIVRRYNGCVIELPYVDELVLDCNRDDIHRMLFKCDTLSIYKPDVNWFHINNVWVSCDANFYTSYDVKLSSTFNTLSRLKLEHVRSTSGMLKNTLCANITTVLDFSTIKNNQRAPIQYVAYMFHNTQLTDIPKMINPPTIPYTEMFDGTLIPESKLKIADTLLKISKKGESS